MSETKKPEAPEFAKFSAECCESLARGVTDRDGCLKVDATVAATDGDTLADAILFVAESLALRAAEGKIADVPVILEGAARLAVLIEAFDLYMKTGAPMPKRWTAKGRINALGGDS